MNNLKLHTMLSAFVLVGVCDAVNTHIGFEFFKA